MNFKVLCALVTFLMFAFLIQESQTDIPQDENIQWVRVKNVALWSIIHLEDNKELIRKAPKIYSLVRSLATDVKSFVTTMNPVYAGATAYLIGVVAISYQFSVEAQRHMMKAQFKHKELEMIVESEILPILMWFEKLYSKGDINSFCLAKNEIDDLIGKALNSLQSFRKDINQQKHDTTSAAEKNEYLKWSSVAVAFGASAAIATAPCAFTAFLACPQLILGSSTLVSSAIGYGFGYNNKLTHDETMSILNDALSKIVELEKVFEMARGPC